MRCQPVHIWPTGTAVDQSIGAAGCIRTEAPAVFLHLQPGVVRGRRAGVVIANIALTLGPYCRVQGQTQGAKASLLRPVGHALRQTLILVEILLEPDRAGGRL